MKRILLTTLTIILPCMSFAYPYIYQPPVNLFPDFGSNSTYIRHQNGQTTQIQQYGNSGVIRYQNGNVDYFNTWGR